MIIVGSHLFMTFLGGRIKKVCRLPCYASCPSVWVRLQSWCLLLCKRLESESHGHIFCDSVEVSSFAWYAIFFGGRQWAKARLFQEKKWYFLIYFISLRQVFYFGAKDKSFKHCCPILCVCSRLSDAYSRRYAPVVWLVCFSGIWSIYGVGSQKLGQSFYHQKIENPWRWCKQILILHAPSVPFELIVVGECSGLETSFFSPMRCRLHRHSPLCPDHFWAELYAMSLTLASRRRQWMKERVLIGKAI